MMEDIMDFVKLGSNEQNSYGGKSMNQSDVGKLFD